MACWTKIATPRAALTVVMVLAGTSTFAPCAVAQDQDMEPPLGIAVGAVDRAGGVSPPDAVGNAFTYQGRLTVSGLPANGPYDFQFKLLDAAAGGSQFGSTITFDNAAVADGRFTVSLDFGQTVFGSGARWLDISVRPGAGGAYTLLTPRQKLNPAPYALSMPNVFTNESSNYVGVGSSQPVTGSDIFGLTAGTSNYGGMYIDTTDPGARPFYGFATGGISRAWTYFNGSTGEWKLYNGGDRLIVRSGGGLEIPNTSDYAGLVVNDAALEGIRIGNVSASPPYGVYTEYPGVDNIALWVNTSQADGNYALLTTDNIEAGVITFSAQHAVARVSGVNTLRAGDIVAATGVTEPVPGGTNRLALVQLADRDATGVVGVVASRMEWRLAEGMEAKGEMILMPADGPASDGDYVSFVISGVTDVRVERGASVAKGARLTAADTGGSARALRTRSLDGIIVGECVPVVGVALENSSGRDTVPVFVNLR